MGERSLMTSIKSAITGLNKLTKTKAAPQHYEAYRKEINAVGNDRGMALLVATNVEEALEWAISRRLFVSDEQYTQLFGYDSPMGTFESKIRIAHALSIFGDETAKNLYLVKTIRNAFAHTRIPMSFDGTPEVMNACALLVVPTVHRGLGTFSWSDKHRATKGRARFQIICDSLIINLDEYGRLCSEPAQTDPLDPRYEAKAIPKSLP